jgi:hypothetical protein
VSIISREHEERVAHDPDIVALQGDVDELAHLRSQRDLSLNLEKRRAERDAIDAERLKRENARRAARGPRRRTSPPWTRRAPCWPSWIRSEIAGDAVQLPKLQEPAHLS